MDEGPGVIGESRSEIAREQEREELLDTLVNVLDQACSTPRDEVIDSMALSAYADGLRLLARYGRFTITDQAGRRVIGTWTA